jgi:VRR-NUC domain-containing protein
VRAITEIGTVDIQPSQQQLWRSGRLAPVWARRFSELFDEDDPRLAESQGHLGYHFGEWLAAIVLHHATGYLSLVSKYEFRKHRRKQEVVERLLSPEPRAALSDRTEHGRAQAPDLLMYAADFSDWFFCEVKGPRDRLGAEQEKKFEALANMSGKPVHLLRLRYGTRDR